jgi:hypothetical protein
MPTIAIIGASTDRSKFGNKAVRAYLRRGYVVFPIHPTAEQVEGQRAYRSILDVPAEQLDRVSLYVPSAVGEKLLAQVAQKHPRELWVNPGAESPELIARAGELGLRAILGCSIVDVGMSPSDL